jgi:serine protease Do
VASYSDPWHASRATRTLRATLALAVLAVVTPAASAQAQAPSARPSRSLQQLSEGFETLASAVMPAVVQVIAIGYAPVSRSDGDSEAGLLTEQRVGGSGVVLRRDGLILTNFHVIDRARRVRIATPARPLPTGSAGSILRPPGRTYEARIVGFDRESDLAVLKVEAAFDSALALADSDAVRQGQLVFAFGSPLGLESSVTMGIVSAVARQRVPDDPMVYLQTDAPINPGNSGGPLVDAQGRVVGISTFIISQSGGNEGVGFAVPSNIARNVFEQIVSRGRVRRGTIGAVAQSITPLLAAGLRLPREMGVIIADVYPGGTADASGLEAGDIVLALDGKPIENARQLEVNLYQRAIGDRVRLDVERDGQRLTVAVEVDEREDDPERFADYVTPEQNLVPRLGILAIDIDRRVRGMLPSLRLPGGVAVAALAPTPQSSGEGLAAGDIITAVNGTLIASLSDLREAIDALEPGQACVLQIQRGAQLRFVALEVP